MELITFKKLNNLKPVAKVAKTIKWGGGSIDF